LYDLKYYFVNTILLLLSFVYTNAQYRFINYNVSDGLSQNSVHCIFQDRDGLIWIGTQDGLNSFDGKSFKKYRANSLDSTTLSDQFVLSIEEDNNGSLWVGTRNGLNKLNKQTGKFSRYYLSADEKNFINSPYSKLIKDKAGRIFLSKSSRKGFINDKGEIIGLDTITNPFVVAVIDEKENLWGFHSKQKKLCTIEKCYSNINNSKVTFYDFPFLNFSADKLKFEIDSNQILYCYTTEQNGRIAFFNTLTRKWEKQVVELQAAINQIYFTKEGKGWVSTDNGLFQINNSKNAYQLIRVETIGIQGSSVLYTYQDKQSNLWVGTANGGLSFHNQSFNNFSITSFDEFGSTVLKAVEVNKMRWVATSKGLYFFDLTKNKKRPFKTYFLNKKISAITIDKNNNIWVAVDREGIYVYNLLGKQINNFSNKSSDLKLEGVLNLFCDSSGRIYLATESGFFVYTADNRWIPFVDFTKNKINTGKYILSFFEDVQKQIWVSKNLGIDVYSKNLELLFSISSAKNDDKISRTIITGCEEDADGNIWIATLSNGVYKYTNTGFKQYTTANGLSGNIITGITKDKQNRIWVTSSTGINIFNRKQNQFYTLSTNDGILAADYFLGGLSKNDKGQILAASSLGLVVIDADNYFINEKNVLARINEVKVDGQNVETKFSKLQLNAGFKTISFEFALKEAFQPEKVFYQYRMVGLDTNWYLLSEESKITYSNLPSKNIRLEVRAAQLPQKLVNAPIEQLYIEIHPFFWQTTWFWVLIIILLNVLTALTIIFLNRDKQKKLAQVQQKIQDERTRISRDLHDNIGAYTTALIAGIDQIKGKSNDTDELNGLSEYAKSIMDYLRETIWVLNHEKISIVDFTDRFKNYAVKIAKHYPQLSVNFLTDLQNERVLTPELSLNLFRIMQEALQNACKHSLASEIIIGFKSTDTIKLFVIDNGVGFPFHMEASGNGIFNMKKRAEEIQFDFSIGRESSGGINICITEK
jgi:ligand-binding sensor domain-containing protein/signal transduction histidine kinase